MFEPVIDSNFIKSMTNLNSCTVGAGDIPQYMIAYGSTDNDGALQVVVTYAIPANTTYVPGSLQIVAGPKSDASGDDQVNFDTVNNRVVSHLGTGANGLTGGTLSPGTSGSSCASAYGSTAPPRRTPSSPTQPKPSTRRPR